MPWVDPVLSQQDHAADICFHTWTGKMHPIYVEYKPAQVSNKANWLGRDFAFFQTKLCHCHRTILQNCSPFGLSI